MQFKNQAANPTRTSSPGRVVGKQVLVNRHISPRSSVDEYQLEPPVLAA